MYTHTLECDSCFSTSYIEFEERVPHVIHCPRCGAQHEVDDVDELDFND